jgi:hypothetical protein
MARVISRLKGTISVHSGEGHTKYFAKPIEDRCLLSNVVGYFSRGGVSGLVREVGLKHPVLAFGFYWVHRVLTRAFYCYEDTVNLGLNVDLPVPRSQGQVISVLVVSCNKQGAVDSLVHYLFYCSGQDSSFDDARKLTRFSLRPIQHATLDLAANKQTNGASTWTLPLLEMGTQF